MLATRGAVGSESNFRGESLSGSGLSPAEMAVLRLVAQDLPNAEVARRLGKSPATVKRQLGAIIRKLGVRSRVGAVIWLERNHDRLH